MQAPNTTFKTNIKFDFGRIMPFTEGFYDIINSKYVEELKKLPIAGVYTVTTEIYRPDLISYRIFGSVIYKMPLMIYNGVISYDQIVSGLELNYPSKTKMEELLYMS
jgi:hypothetical protein